MPWRHGAGAEAGAAEAGGGVAGETKKVVHGPLTRTGGSAAASSRHAESPELARFLAPLPSRTRWAPLPARARLGRDGMEGSGPTPADLAARSRLLERKAIWCGELAAC